MIRNILLIIFIFISFNACIDKNKDDSIKIGVILGLTGKYSDLGLYEKNGIVLAFDKINYQINNKKVELIFKDDKQDKEVNEKAVKELIESDVKYIIGNATSSMTEVTLDITSKYNDIFQISPSASSSKFSNIDDNFFRLQTANSSKHFINLIKLLQKNNAKKIFLIGDKKNKSYLYDYMHIFNDNKNMKFEEIIDASLPYEEILEKIKPADFIVQVQNSRDSASLIQYLRINNNHTPIISSGWAMNKEFIENSGKWSEGIYFISSDYINYEDEEYRKFEKYFSKVYRYEANRSNMQGYQTAKVLIEALQHGNKNVNDIKKYIIEKETFNISGDKISFNKFGDIKTPYYIFEVIDSKFKKIK
ncbi:ABC transporter substrate-binding protein [Poseidonibacter lekithochrous]|uniref:ABC transporter substrate-binding protein n=1 Tax=Poseidonibacter TaxID=2321187 RepID=UPI001C0A5140|nr:MULTISPECIES: ABC transporter substrate-binding protein [Poseidonibacter]MBU3015366.1 ABC transporter substrate-binding protein [Poseidonibacter lekithochrous]MDO6828665.1 ABC transporter substrate-binding protein [Poseidonibacter sp. 1_MG-2023]